VHMALDVLSCLGEFKIPQHLNHETKLNFSLFLTATSVDVERAFSFGQDYLSEKRHRLTAQSICRGITEDYYRKKNKIEGGLLEKFKKGKNEVKNNSKYSGKNIFIDLEKL